MMQRIVAAAMLLVLAGCSPTEGEPHPLLGGPHEVFGIWENYMIVCTIPLTLTTPFPIQVVDGEILATFPAEGDVIAQVEHRLSPDDLEILWGGEWSGRVTRSLQIRPTVQHLDYEVHLDFTWQARDGSAVGQLDHHWFCLGRPGEEPRATPSLPTPPSTDGTRSDPLVIDLSAPGS
jgi:hypothetical protein